MYAATAPYACEVRCAEWYYHVCSEHKEDPLPTFMPLLVVRLCFHLMGAYTLLRTSLLETRAAGDENRVRWQSDVLGSDGRICLGGERVIPCVRERVSE
jgi:hypothetical protein